MRRYFILEKRNGIFNKLAFGSKRLRMVLMVLAFTCMSAFQAMAADTPAFDVSTELSTSFTSMANTMLATISATLPVVMSVMSAYLCINFGIRFFKRFAK